MRLRVCLFYAFKVRYGIFYYFCTLNISHQHDNENRSHIVICHFVNDSMQ